MKQITPYTDGMKCFKVMPLVYDESLSYYEVLCKAVQKMNDIIDTINIFQADYEGYTDTQVATLKEIVDEQDEKIIALIHEQISTLENVLQTQVKQVYETIANTDEATRGWVLYELDKVYKYIVKYFTDTMQLYNPTNGELESLGKVMNDIYDALRYFGITAAGFDKLELNAYEYDGKMIYAKEYDLYAYEKLVKSPDFYMFSPFDGSYMYYQDIIYQLASLHASSPISASQYDAKGITATAFVTYDMTAYDYDTKALIIIV